MTDLVAGAVSAVEERARKELEAEELLDIVSEQLEEAWLDMWLRVKAPWLTSDQRAEAIARTR